MYRRNPAQGRGAYRDRHERGPGGGGRRSHRREWFRRAESRERRRRAHDRCDRRTAKSCRPGARGLCAKSCGDVCCPTGPRASAIRRATGAIVHRSPGRARHKPFQPLRREGRDAPVALFPAVHCSAICPWHSGSIGASRAPGLPCALFQLRVKRGSKARAKHAARMQAHVSPSSTVSCPGRSAASLGGALQSRGPCNSEQRGFLDPGSAERHCVPHRVRDTRKTSVVVTVRHCGAETAKLLADFGQRASRAA
jgi:hypothetical protein